MINGKYNLKVPLDDGIDITVEAFNFQGGQYKKMADKLLNKFCESAYEERTKDGYSQFFEASTVKIPFGTCPYPAGKNELNNFMIDENGVLPAYVPGGEKWKVDVRFLKGGKILGGYNAYVLVRSEQSLLKGR